MRKHGSKKTDQKAAPKPKLWLKLGTNLARAAGGIRIRKA